MKLTFWGAARTVTGSLHMLELEGGRVFLDCGLYQGRRAEAQNGSTASFRPSPTSVDAVLLSHAHIDHSGLLPKLYADGFRGRVYCTSATRDLCATMLLDSAHIQEKDAEWVNRRERRRGRDEIQPLYDADDVQGVMSCFEAVDYGTRFSPLPGLEVEYRDAGHILGSATMTLTHREGGRAVTLGFTGDLGRPRPSDPPGSAADAGLRLPDLGVHLRWPSARALGSRRRSASRTSWRTRHGGAARSSFRRSP